VRIALHYKEIDFDYEAVDLLTGEQLEDEYLKKNPSGFVPALEIDGLTLTESLPIIEYLDETRDGPKLLPEDPVKRFQARRLAEVVNAGT